MEEINLLLANENRELNNRIEAQVLDACYSQVFVTCTRTSRADEFVELGRSGRFHLIIVAIENLLPAPARKGPWVSSEEALRGIREIRARCSVPVIAVAVVPEHEAPLLAAGADCVMRFPFDTPRLQREVRRLLGLRELTPEAPASNGWLAPLLLRLFGRLKNA